MQFFYLSFLRGYSLWNSMIWEPIPCPTLVRSPSRRTDTDIPLKGCPVVRWGRLIKLISEDRSPPSPRTFALPYCLLLSEDNQNLCSTLKTKLDRVPLLMRSSRMRMSAELSASSDVLLKPSSPPVPQSDVLVVLLICSQIKRGA